MQHAGTYIYLPPPAAPVLVTLVSGAEGEFDGVLKHACARCERQLESWLECVMGSNWLVGKWAEMGMGTERRGR